MVESMYDTMWEYLLFKMKELQNTDLYVKNIGTFKLRYSQLDRFIKVTLDAANRNKMNAVNVPENEEHYLAKSASYYKDHQNIIALKEKLHQQWSKVQEKKKLRRAYITRDLEEQGTDNGRDKE